MLNSYAQNFEDVILHRALKGVGNGFYIDVGAHDPCSDSVSLAFYELGWRGIHVEPNAFYAGRLREARPDEEVLEALLGDENGSLPFYLVGDTGLSTADAKIAARHELAGFETVLSSVRSLKMSDFLDRVGEREIHWLKIDVEGFERQVIEGWAPARARPWIVVIESTLPNSPEPSHADWEPTLLAYGYEFVYFDGLNRFYVSKLKPELKAAFGLAPNVFDGFRRPDLAAQERLLALMNEVAALRHRLA